ncbi:hypothetical protein K523DRAFT_371324 [Schizophyllum commune Tattone D]|nr:hypothetical protein K523DRAFT_371324 [Schizophyllum commune Tattone D]
MSQRQLFAPIQPGNTRPARVDPAPPIVRSSAVDPGAYMRLTRTGTATQSTASTTVAAPSPVIRVPIAPAPAAYSSANVIYVASSPAPEIKDEMPTSETMPELAATESTHELAALGFYASSSPAPDSTMTSKMMHELPALASNAATACTPAAAAVPRKFNPASTAYTELSDSDDEPMIVDTVMVDVKPSLDKVATAHDPPPASAPAHSASVVSASIDSAPMPASSPAAITVKKRGRPRKTDPPAPPQQQKKKKAPARVPVADKGKGKAPTVEEVPTDGAPAPAVPQAKKARATRQRPDASDTATKTIALSYAVNRLQRLDEERKEGRKALADANKEIMRLTVSVERYPFGLTDSTCSDLATYPQSQAYNTGFNGLAPAPAMGDQFGAGWGSGLMSGPTGASAWSGVAGGSNMVGGTGGEGPSGAGAWSGVAGGSNMAGDVQMAYGSTHNAYNT